MKEIIDEKVDGLNQNAHGSKAKVDSKIRELNSENKKRDKQEMCVGNVTQK